MSSPETFAMPWLAAGLPLQALLLSAGVVGGLALAIGLWLALAPGPRRRRGCQRVRRLLQQGAWEPALRRVEALRGRGQLSAHWTGVLNNLEGESHHLAGETALREKRYEDSLTHLQHAARLLNLNEAEARSRVVEALLAEVRWLFAEDRKTAAALDLIDRVLRLHSPCPEASFWQGLCHVRDGRSDLALPALRVAHEAGQKAYVDPPLYLGAVLLRDGKPQEALRYLSEANRVDAGCPFVGWQLGAALLAAGGDAGMAVRALQRSLARFQQFRTGGGSAQRVWVEGMPDGRSFVRRLAMKHPFTCPVMAGDLPGLVHQVQHTLAQAQYRLGNYQAATDLYTTLLQECPPLVPYLRGLGLALVKQERHDEAFKHLRIAYGQEEPKTHVTTGYLALCGAMGKPKQPDDKPRNVAWAVGLLSKFDRPGDKEWAWLNSAVFAEARAIELPVAIEDQARLGDLLVSVDATDAAAAAAVDHLARTDPEAVRPEHAWLYCRAAQQQGFVGSRDRELFGHTFRDAGAARAYFAQRQWDFDAVEYTFLERSASSQPGGFPSELGLNYPARGERFLLERSRRLEEVGQKDVALASVAVLLRLAPASTAAHDRAAYLHHRRGELDKATEWLVEWHRLDPANPLPLLRRAVLERQRGDGTSCTEAIRLALERTSGERHAAVAFLGARLTLAGLAPEFRADKSDSWQQAHDLLHECLQHDPDHLDALCLLACVNALRGDREALAAQSAAMHRPGVASPRFQFLAAVCHLAGGHHEQVIEAATRAAVDSALGVECRYLLGWAHLHRHDFDLARAAFLLVANTPGSPAAEHAKALLGRLCFLKGNVEEAIQWWDGVDAEVRRRWHLDETLRSAVYLAGLRAYHDGRFESAAERFRKAAELGSPEPDLNTFLIQALVQAARRLLQADHLNHVPERAAFLASASG